MQNRIVSIRGTDISLKPGPWPLPEALRQSVPAVWARMQAEKPHIWDGRILGFTPPVVGADGVLRAEAREDSFSAFLTWRESGFADIGMAHMFGTALILSSDNALIFGVMGGETVNAGRVYPPGGSLEPRDVRADGRVDVESCIALEMLEETGLLATDAKLGPLFAIFHGPRVSIARVFRSEMTADELVEVIRDNLEGQEERELADVVACRTIEDAARAGEVMDYAEQVLAALALGHLGEAL